jgi:two-component system, LytTR family, response regulator
MKLFLRVLFWALISSGLIIIFSAEYGGYANSFYFVTFLLPVILGTSYMFNAILIPRFLLEKRYFKFGLYSLYTIIISLNLEMLVITLAFIVLANYQYEQMIPAAKNVFGLAITMYFVVLVKSFVKLLKISYVRHEKILALEEKQKNLQQGYLLVRADRKKTKVLLADILYIESLSDYVKIITQGKSVIITREKISKIEGKLTGPFLRIHRSFIVNTDKINNFSSETIDIGSMELPISRTYKKAVRQYLQRKES